MNLQHYIQSGIIEAYALGLATPQEAAELESLLPEHPELKDSLFDFEARLEYLALDRAVPPPSGNWPKIEEKLKEFPAIRPNEPQQNGHSRYSQHEYITAHEASSTHIRVHKHWRPAFITVFILSKIFLILFIYFLLQYQHARQEIQQLQERIHYLEK